MARNSNEFRKRFPDGREIVFGIRNGQVQKIRGAYFSRQDFLNVLQEAKEVLLQKPKPVKPKRRVVLNKLSPIDQMMLAGAAANERYHRGKLGKDY